MGLYGRLCPRERVKVMQSYPKGVGRMTKRFRLICLIVMLGALPLSGGTSKVSVTGFYALSSGKESVTLLGVPAEGEAKAHAIGLKVQGTSVFSPFSDVGLSYKAALSKTLLASVDGVSHDPIDDPLMLVVGVGGAYQIRPSLNMRIELGGGLDYSIQSQTESGVQTTYNMCSVTTYAEFNYAIRFNIFLNVGISISYPLGGTVRTKGGGTTTTGDVNSSVFTFAPYVGVAFSY